MDAETPQGRKSNAGSVHSRNRVSEVLPVRGSGRSSREGSVMLDAKQRKVLKGFLGLMTAGTHRFQQRTRIFKGRSSDSRYPTLLFFPTPWGLFALCSLEIEGPD